MRIAMRLISTTQQHDMENTLLGTWAHTFGPNYPQVIDSDPRWRILYGTLDFRYGGHVHQLYLMYYL